MMNRKPFLFALNAIAYLVCTFALALIWHIWLFKPLYDALGWRTPDGEAIALGFAAVTVQAVVLALVFQMVKRPAPLMPRLTAFIALAFLYLWSSHVLGDAAKLPLTSTTGFIVLETAYLALQFVIYGAVLWIIHTLFDPDVKEVDHAP